MDDLFDIVEDETLSFDDDKIYSKEKEKSCNTMCFDLG